MYGNPVEGAESPIPIEFDFAKCYTDHKPTFEKPWLIL